LNDDGFDRRAFLKGAVAGGAAAALPLAVDAQPVAPPSYSFFNPEESAFVEALVDHLVPADALGPKGTDIGIQVYIDRALAGRWGKGDRLYMQGPWKEGTPSQGYQLPLTPAALYRSGIAAANAYCVKTWGRSFDRLATSEREEFLLGLLADRIAFESGPPAREFFQLAYQTVMEGMFSDPRYGGNRDRAGWKLVGFPGPG
jgi:gluconate 2-dehydrogenase gamma chain